MHIRILGSTAGGGSPQWSCNYRNCREVHDDSVAAQPRTQSSIALPDDSECWVLCNASPDIRAQITALPALQPTRRPCDAAAGVIVLLDSQIDHTTGLFSLCEDCPHEVWCTQMVHQNLSEGFPLFPVPSHWNGDLHHRPIALDGTPFAIPACPRLRFTTILLRGSAPLYSPNRGDPHSGGNIGLFVEDLDNTGALFCVPGLGEVDEALLERIRRTNCLLVGGALRCDDEMLVCEVGDKLDRQMGHLAQNGPGGVLEVLAKVPAARKVLIHINNTNLILDTASAERIEPDTSGIEVAWDGMHIQLQGANMSCVVMNRAEFERTLCDKGRYYHIHHPFRVAIYEGRASREQIQGWVANRFYYQVNIPLKNAAILASCPDREVRRGWIQRILDHDSAPGEAGGIEAWLRLAEAVGLEREQVLSEGRVLPDVRFAVDAYVNFARRVSWQEATSSSLTEFSASQIHQSRLNSWPRHYPWIEAAGYEYFRSRLAQAWRDAEHGLRVTLEHYRTREAQERMLDILQFRLDVLWSIPDTTSMAYELERPPYHTVTREWIWYRGLAS